MLTPWNSEAVQPAETLADVCCLGCCARTAAKTNESDDYASVPIYIEVKSKSVTARANPASSWRGKMARNNYCRSIHETIEEAAPSYSCLFGLNAKTTIQMRFGAL